MKRFFRNMTEALELQGRVLCDTSPFGGQFDAVYIFGQTRDNESSVLKTGAKLILEKKATFVIFLKTGKLVNGETFTSDYEAKLIKLGVPQKNILSTHLHDSLAHTHTEAIALVELARQMGWERIYVTAPPFHQLRVFAETVTAICASYPTLKAYNKVGLPLPWTTTVVHSQNILVARRCDLFKPEFERLDAYHSKGDLVTAKKVLNYLDNRD